MPHQLFDFNHANGLTRNLTQALLNTPHSPETAQLYQQWINNPHNPSRSDHLHIFSLQTAFSIIVQLMACRLLRYDALNPSDFALPTQQLMSKLDEKLAHTPFYAWYLTPDQWNEDIAHAIEAIITALQATDWQANEPKDWFRELYLNIMPNHLRHNLGEHYTPLWLADRTVQQALQLHGKPDWTAIDPCCGSGTFIVTLIRHRLAQPSDLSDTTLQDTVLKRIHGMDCNPLSVMMANINYRLAIQHLNPHHWFASPIKQGDALFPSQQAFQDIEVIVGNPPWVKLSDYPKAYADQVKQAGINKAWFAKQRYVGAISLNVCAVIAQACASAWFNQQGVLAFIMPRTLLTQDSYEGFRRFELNDQRRMHLQQVDDWELAGKVFEFTQEKCMTYYYGFTPQEEGATLTVHQKRPTVALNHRATSFDDIKDGFTVSHKRACALSEQHNGLIILPDTEQRTLRQFQQLVGTNDYQARSGCEFLPQSLYCLKFLYPSGSDRAVFQRLDGTQLELETLFMRELIKSPQIQPFQLLKSEFWVIFPYREGERFAVDEEELADTCPLLYAYLCQHREAKARTSAKSRSLSMGTAFYALSKVGLYTFAPHKAVFRDNTIMQSAVVSSSAVCDKHAPYIAQDKAGNFISEDEAHYLSAILNTDWVKRYFRYRYHARSYSIGLHIKMPKYQTHDPLHQALSQTAKHLSKKPNGDKARLNELYQQLCQL